MAPPPQSSNPIFQRELKHRRRTIATRTGLLPYLGLGVFFLLISLLTANLQSPWENLLISFPLMSAWLVHVVISFHIINSGINIINQEYLARSWDLLILTGVSARQIVIGKWLALLHQAAPPMLFLGIFRVFLLLLALLRATQGNILSLTHHPMVPWITLFLSLVLLLTVLDVMCCTALSLFVSALIQHKSVALLLASALRLIPAIFVMLTFLVSPIQRIPWALNLTDLHSRLSLADSGIGITMAAIYYHGNPTTLLSPLTSVAIVFLVALAGAFTATLTIVTRRGASSGGQARN